MTHYYSYSSYSDTLEVLMAIFGVMFLVFGIFFLAVFLIGAVGRYNLSRSRGYSYPWLSFIPVASSWVLGGIADNINACSKKRTYYRVILTVTHALCLLASVIMIIVFLIQMSKVLMYTYSGSESELFAFTMQITLFSALMSLSSIAFRIVSLICEYAVYQDYSPKHAVLFLLLSIFFGIGDFFIFAIRNKPSVSLWYQSYYKNADPSQFTPPPPPPFV